ncbi:unnamed protein product [Rotaria sp. Silwood2]|nr:unnamed protein product [Rotaria sp. Silwood2]CAF3246290.1 unnamed protein product [Rotaria sp. Silwood2]CAF4326921.1 unnamed protein product [Rotaria sp. Silwood2]CAF4424955.1 unnamed protein product [Rotaria sp. Silwood2]
MLPVEDVLLISVKSEIKTGIQADIKSEITPIYAESENCCDSLLSCCRKTHDYCCCCCRQKTKVTPFVHNTTTIFHDEDPNRRTNVAEEHLPVPNVKEDCCNCFRCWCCRIKKVVDIIRRTNTVAERKEQRVIIITIEYSKYSNLDTPSNASLLTSEQQSAYYKEKFHLNKELQFYAITDKELNSKSFELKSREVEAFCRTVMQLKGMRDYYPSDNELQKIIDQSHQKTIGDEFNEEVLQLSLEPMTKERSSQIQKLPQ